MPPPPSRTAAQRTLIVPVFTNFTLTSNGTTTPAYVEFPDDAQRMMEQLGPYCTSITGHTFTLGRTTNHNWNCVFWNGFDGKNWSASPTSLFSGISANGAVVQTAFSTTSALMLRMRFALGVQNGAGTAIESAAVSLALAFDFKT